MTFAATLKKGYLKVPDAVAARLGTRNLERPPLREQDAKDRAAAKLEKLWAEKAAPESR
jgi:hypothetical protein